MLQQQKTNDTTQRSTGRKHTEKKLKVGKMMSHLHASPCNIGTEFF